MPTLLILENNERSREALSRGLELEGYTVTVASGGEEALAALAAGGHDLVLLDVEAPGISGFDVIGRLRARWSPAELPVIMVTARSDGADVLDAFRQGANDYVTRPINFPVVLARIATQLQHKRAVAALRESEERHALALQGANDRLAYDALTGLPNRFLFVDLLDRAIRRAQRRHGQVLALLALALDRFTMVGDSMGPAIADRLLVAVAQRLQGSLRGTDALAPGESAFTVARFGGDEFTVLLEDVTGVNAALRVAERLRAALEAPFDIDGRRLFTSARVGLAIGAAGCTTPEQMLRDAATALDRARRDGAAPCQIFDPAMRERAVARLELENDLQKGIADGAFEAYYQPIVSIRTGRIVAFEALARWHHPHRGIVNPAGFIGVAEETGLIMQIGRSVLADSCRQLAAWRGKFGPAAPDAICVNVSNRQFLDPALPDIIGEILATTGLSAWNLRLEVTESVLIKDIAAARATVARLQGIGIEWSLDDFGTGYSSLSYLHQLKVDTLKVDRSFVSRMGDNGDGAEVVRAIVELGHNLGLDVVAEGVETEAQLKGLRALGCQFCQGFLFSKPVEAAVASVLIATQPMFEPALA